MVRLTPEMVADLNRRFRENDPEREPNDVYTPSQQQLDQNAKAFVYHAPKDNQPERYQHIRKTAGELAHLLVTNCPPSRELSLALTKLEEAAFWANAAIARNE